MQCQCQLRCKMIDKRMWASQTPLRHFKAKIEEKHGVKSVAVRHYTLYINEHPLIQSLWIFRHQEKLMGSWLAGIGRRYPEEDREEGLQRLQIQQICVLFFFRCKLLDSFHIHRTSLGNATTISPVQRLVPSFTFQRWARISAYCLQPTHVFSWNGDSWSVQDSLQARPSTSWSINSRNWIWVPMSSQLPASKLQCR